VSDIKLKIMRETTKYSKVEYEVPQHDYLIEGGHGGRLVAMRKAGTHEWEKFSKLFLFSKKHRAFKELREPIPDVFVTPFTSDPWKNATYNSLEAFMS